MRRRSGMVAIIVLAAFAAMPVLADTLVLKTGERVSGYFEGGSARVVKFRTADGAVKDYDILTVQTIQFGDTSTSSTSTTSSGNRIAPATTSTPGPDPRLRPSTDRPPAQPS